MGWFNKLLGSTSGNVAEVNASQALLVAQTGIASVSVANRDRMVDSFERLRVSEPRIAFEYSYATLPSASPAIWENTAFGAGTQTLNANSWMTDLNTTTAINTGYWIQAYCHVRYAPGISTLIRRTFCFNALQSGLVMKIGFFTDQGTFPSNQGDGIYVQASGSTISLVRRTFVSGGAGAEAIAAQGTWSLDNLDGSGPSGVNLDWTLTQHFVIEMQWLGVGIIRIGFNTPLGLVFAHEFYNVNLLSVPWCRTGTLPIRTECYSTSGLATPGKLSLINDVVIQEGDVKDKRGWRYFAATSGATAKTIGTAASLYPIMALRALLTNDTSKRARFIPQTLNISILTVGTGTTSLQWALLAAPTPMTGATFAVSASSTSAIAVDIAATATTAVTGSTLFTGVLPNVVGTYALPLDGLDDNMIVPGQNAAGSLTITGMNVLTLAVGTLTGTTTVAPVIVGSIGWKEIV
jgi:hypothetical protein